jgi:hypothetical protein
VDLMGWECEEVLEEDSTTDGDFHSYQDKYQINNSQYNNKYLFLIFI